MAQELQSSPMKNAPLSHIKGRFHVNMTEILANLSSKLRALHKDLLRIQVYKVEEIDQCRYGAYQVLHLSIHDSHFDWLRILSSLITQIDHRVHNEEAIEILDAHCLFDETTRLFHGEYPQFSKPYKEALDLEPHLYMKQAEVLSALEDLRPYAKNMHEMHSENESHKFEPKNLQDS